MNEKHSGELEYFLQAVRAEWWRAHEKFPENKHVNAALVEEVGEVSNALLENAYGNKQDWHVYAEAVQVATMAARIAIDGDASFPYDPKKAIGTSNG